MVEIESKLNLHTEKWIVIDDCYEETIVQMRSVGNNDLQQHGKQFRLCAVVRANTPIWSYSYREDLFIPYLKSIQWMFILFS